MLQVCRRLDLVQEPLGTDNGRELGTQHLERHVPVVALVPGEVDHRHATATEFPLDAISAPEGGVENSNRSHSAGIVRVAPRRRQSAYPRAVASLERRLHILTGRNSSP